MKATDLAVGAGNCQSGDGAVLINAEGKRFIDEVGTRDVVS